MPNKFLYSFAMAYVETRIYHFPVGVVEAVSCFSDGRQQIHDSYKNLEPVLNIAYFGEFPLLL